MDTKCDMRKCSISAVVTRVDGTVENLGVIAEPTYSLGIVSKREVD